MNIDRALIIRRQQVELSKKYAEQTAESCIQVGLPYEFIDAVEFLDCEKAFESVGAKKAIGYKNTQGNCCCHSSHIKCWRRIVELDKACIILEHDAIVLGDVTTIDIPDMSVVTFGHRVPRRNSYHPVGPIERLKSIEKAIGVHACGLTPTTAQWLVTKAEEGVSVGVDKWLMMERKSGLPLFVCEPEQVVCWDRVSTSNYRSGQGDDVDPLQSPKQNSQNYSDAFSDRWKDGLR